MVKESLFAGQNSTELCVKFVSLRLLSKSHSDSNLETNFIIIIVIWLAHATGLFNNMSCFQNFAKTWKLFCITTFLLLPVKNYHLVVHNNEYYYRFFSKLSSFIILRIWVIFKCVGWLECLITCYCCGVGFVLIEVSVYSLLKCFSHLCC